MRLACDGEEGDLDEVGDGDEGAEEVFGLEEGPLGVGRRSAKGLVLGLEAVQRQQGRCEKIKLIR